MSDCIFCKIVNGEIPADKVYETKNVLVFKDINPVAPVHYLIIPKEHIVSLSESDENHKELLAEMLLTASKLGKDVPELENNYRLVISTGPKAGQVVMHMHFHLIGGRELGWPPG